jgi:hypothetical protein
LSVVWLDGEKPGRSEMKLSLLFAAVAVALRTALFYTGVEPEPAVVIFSLMGSITLLTFLSGHVELREEPNAPLPSIFRAGLRASAVFALLYALFLFFFFKVLNTSEFPMRIAGIVHESVARGIPEADARHNMEAFFTPGKYAFLTFIALLSLGAVNALIFAIVQHKFLRRFRDSSGVKE